MVERADVPGSPSEAAEAAPPAPEPLAPHAIVEADGRIYALTGDPVPPGPLDYRYGSSLVGVDVDVVDGEAVEGHVHYTLVGLHEGSCVARAVRRAVVRASVFDASAGSVRPTAPRSALELEGCAHETFGLSELAFALEGKHPEARLFEARDDVFLQDDDAVVAAEDLPEGSLPSHTEVRSFGRRLFPGGRLAEVVVSTYGPLTGEERTVLLLADGEALALSTDLDYEGGTMLFVAGRQLLVSTVWPQRIRFSEFDGLSLALAHDVEVLVSLEYYAADDGCG